MPITVTRRGSGIVKIYDSLVFLAALAIGIYAVIWSFSYLLACYHPLPYLEQWLVIGLHQSYAAGTLDWTSFWMGNNEHLIPIQLVVNFLDFAFFGANNLFSLGIMVLLQFSVLVVLVCAVWFGIDSLSRGQVILFSVFALLMVLNPMQAENLTWAFQVGFVGSFSLAALAIATCSLLAESRGLLRILVVVGVFLLGLCASLALASGILVWPFLLLMCWGVRLDWKAYSTVFAGFLIVMLLLILQGGTPSTTGVLEQALSEPLDVFSWYLALLGNPFSIFPIPVRQTLGLVLLLAVGHLLISLVIARMRGERISPPYAILVVCTAYLAASCVSISVGRYGTGLEYASTGRYITPSMLLWTFLTASFFVRFSQNLGSAFLRTLLSVVMYIALLGPTFAYASTHRSLQHSVDRRERALVAYRHGVFAESLFQSYHYQHPSVVMQWLDYLRQNQLSVFSDPSRLVGAPPRELIAKSAMLRCIGDVQVSEAIYEDQAQFSGWALSDDKSRMPHWIHLYDAVSQAPVGGGSFVTPSPGLSRSLGLPFEAKTYVAFAHLGTAEEIEIIGQFPNGDLCSIAEVERPQPSRYWSIDWYRKSHAAEILGQNMEGSAIETDVDEADPAIDGGDPVFRTGSDASYDVGRIVFTVEIPDAAGELVMPMKTGPTASRQHVEILDADGRTLDKISLRPMMQWESVVLDVRSRSSGRIRVHLVDDHAGWGSWLAVGYPRYLNVEAALR